MIKRLLAPGFMRALLLLWVFLYVGLALWVKDSFSIFVYQLGHNPLVQVPFVLFTMLVAYHTWRGFWGRIRGEGVLKACLWVVLPLGVLLYLAGFFLNATIRQQGEIFVGLTDRVLPPWEQKSLLVAGIRAEVAGQWEEGIAAEQPQALFNMEPQLIMKTSEGRELEVGVFPPRKIGQTYYHILDFGLAPGVLLKDAEGRVLMNKNVILKVFPPGGSDTFEVKGTDYRITLSIAPERELKKGTETARIYRPLEAHYRVLVERGERTVYEGETRGEVMEFEGLTLRLFKPGYWVRLEAASTPGYGIFVAGMVLALIGLPLMLVRMALLALAALKWKGQE